MPGCHSATAVVAPTEAPIPSASRAQKCPGRFENNEAPAWALAQAWAMSHILLQWTFYTVFQHQTKSRAGQCWSWRQSLKAESHCRDNKNDNDAKRTHSILVELLHAEYTQAYSTNRGRAFLTERSRYQGLCERFTNTSQCFSAFHVLHKHY